MRKLDNDIAEVHIFLKKWHIASPISENPASNTKLKSAYKQFHALLIWNFVTDSVFSPKDDRKIYFTEVVSDLSNSLFLALSGFYKPSRNSLRSSIENFIRVFLLSKKHTVSNVKSVFDLFAECKKQYKKDRNSLNIINKLHLIYSELCKSVHSSHIDYLSLSIPFEEINSFNQKSHASLVENIRVTSALINQGTFWIWEEHLSAAGHENSDMVRDALPRILKREKTKSRSELLS